MSRITYDQLRNYQLEGVDFLASHYNALLADERGLGKTVQVGYAMRKTNITTAIIACPASCKTQWKTFLVENKMYSADDVFIVQGRNPYIPESKKVLIINFELCREKKIQKKLKARKWDLLVVDEIQFCKSIYAQQTQALLSDNSIGAACTRHWFLSGSPILKAPLDLFPMLASSAPDVISPYNDYHEYGMYFCSGYVDDYGQEDYTGGSHLDELHERLKPFMLCRKIKDVCHELPDLIRETVYLEDVRYQDHPEYLGEGFMQMATMRRVLAESKVKQAAAYIKERLQVNEKVLVFTYHTAVMTVLAKELIGFNPITVNGSTPSQKRKPLVDEFVNNKTRRVFIGQINSMGTGLDGLQYGANEIICMEPDWSPEVINQAIGRLHRFGQVLPVVVTELRCYHELEFHIDATASDKADVIRQVIKPNGKGEYDDMSLETEAKKMTEALIANTAMMQQLITVMGGKPVAAATQPAPQAPATPAPAVGDLINQRVDAAAQALPPVASLFAGNAAPAPVPGVQSLVTGSAPATSAPASTSNPMDAIINGAVQKEFTFEELKQKLQAKCAGQDPAVITPKVQGMLAALNITGFGQLKPEQHAQANQLIEAL